MTSFPKKIHLTHSHRRYKYKGFHKKEMDHCPIIKKQLLALSVPTKSSGVEKITGIS